LPVKRKSRQNFSCWPFKSTSNICDAENSRRAGLNHAPVIWKKSLSTWNWSAGAVWKISLVLKLRVRLLGSDGQWERYLRDTLDHNEVWICFNQDRERGVYEWQIRLTEAIRSEECGVSGDFEKAQENSQNTR
jgi:hypothetical protein